MPPFPRSCHYEEFLWEHFTPTSYALCHFLPLCIRCIKALKSRRCAQDNRNKKDAAILSATDVTVINMRLRWKCIVKSACADTNTFHNKWWNGNDIKFGKLDDVPDVNKENNKTEHMKVFSWPRAVCWQIQPWIMDILLPSGRYHKNLNCILSSHHKYGFPRCGFSHMFFCFFLWCFFLLKAFLFCFPNTEWVKWLFFYGFIVCMFAHFNLTLRNKK